MPTPVVEIDAVMLANFGAVALPRFATQAAQLALAGAGTFTTAKLIGTDAVVTTSYLGTAVYDVVTLKKSEDDEGFTLPLAVALTYRKQKNIVRTAITNRDGRIKEYINMDDPVVTLRGIITTGSHVRPVDIMALMDDYYRHVGNLIVESQFLGTMGFTSCIMKELSMDAEKGKTGSVPFTMELEYDDPEVYKALANEYLVAEIGVTTP